MNGRHPHGCFFGGPVGESYWFIVHECQLDHPDAESAPLFGTQQGAHDAYEHLRLAGLLRSDESG